ncbi:MAG TPA: hypothetical protein VN026_00640 [Bacteroidia bacterium]|nr:hypothetical protein [Bacteroidia bacterium]
MRIILLFLLISPFLTAQTSDKIKIKKEDALYFFQVGQKSDTISSDKNDLFYLKITGPLRCNARIEVVNGRLTKTKNDSIFILKKVPNLQYEHYFQDSTFIANKTKGKDMNENCFKFVTHINGANEGNGNAINIQIYNINTRETLLNNKFYYK